MTKKQKEPSKPKTRTQEECFDQNSLRQFQRKGKRGISRTKRMAFVEISTFSSVRGGIKAEGRVAKGKDIILFGCTTPENRNYDVSDKVPGQAQKGGERGRTQIFRTEYWNEKKKKSIVLIWGGGGGACSYSGKKEN